MLFINCNILNKTQNVININVFVNVNIYIANKTWDFYFQIRECAYAYFVKLYFILKKRCFCLFGLRRYNHELRLWNQTEFPLEVCSFLINGMDVEVFDELLDG